MSGRAFVREGLCPGGLLSGRDFVREGLCPEGLMSPNHVSKTHAPFGTKIWDMSFLTQNRSNLT